MKIYVASSWRNPYQPQVVKALLESGHEVYDFRNPPNGSGGFAWSDIDTNWENWTTDEYIQALKSTVAEHGFNSDFDGMKWADACVMVLPCGRSANTEAGWMKGAGKKVYVFSPTKQEPELMYKIYDNIFDDINILVADLSTETPSPTSSLPVREGEEKRNYEKFFTPKHIAMYMVGLVNPQKDEVVLEPSAGKGDIVRAIKQHNAGVRVFAFDINKDYEPYLRNAGATVTVIKDFLTIPVYAKCTSCIANPPFGNGIDLQAHFNHICAHVKDGGQIAMIVPEDFTPDIPHNTHRIENWSKNSDGTTTAIKIIHFTNGQPSRPSPVEVISAEEVKPDTLNKELYEFLTGRDKPFFVDKVKKLLNQYDKEEISFSKFVESLNETAYYWHSHFTTPSKEVQDMAVRFDAIPTEVKAEEKERTAMEILIDFAKTKIYNTDGPTLIINKATELLAKEREQIIDAYTDGCNNGLAFTGKALIQTDNQYFTNTFNKP